MVTRKTPLILLCFLIIVIASCKKAGVAPGTAKGKDLVLTAVEQQQISANNAFTLKLFKNLDSANNSSTNLFVSPLSVGLALGMTSNGASGQTLTAMRNTIGFNNYTPAQINSYYHDLITDLPQLDPNTNINIANSIWYSNSFSVLSPFLQTNSNSYNAKIQALNFGDPSSLNTINNWVNQQTNGAIPTIISEIGPSDLMYLINAIYFKSIWNEKFDAANTKPSSFTLNDNSVVQTDFMSDIVDCKMFTNNEAEVIELPYANNKYSMVIVEPLNGTVQQLTASIDTTKWQTWITGLSSRKIDLQFPKFTYSYSTDLKGALTDLGMGNAFSNSANFSLINPTAALQISKVLHKAYIKVDETGTTAAAATGVVIATTAPLIPLITINHPFVFAIRQVSSGLVLFTGTVNNPSLTSD